MVSKEEISMVGFTIVAYAGDAKTDLLNALKLASGEELETTFIMSHGQDTLMTTMLLRDEVKYFIDLYKQNLALRAEIEQLKEEMN